MRLSLDLGIGSVATMGAGGASVRSVPGADSDTFYVVHRVGSTNYVYRFTKAEGSSGPTSLGVQWLGWRLNGAGTRPTFEGNPLTGAVFQLDTEGASGLTAAAPGTISAHEWHGVGAAGSMASEAVTMDGVSYDPMAGERRGNAWSVRNTITASDGTNTLTRDLSWAIEPAGGIRPTRHSVTGSGFTRAYFASPVGSSVDYDLIDVLYDAGGDWENGVPLGSVNAVAYLETARGVRIRDGAGNFVSFVGDLPDVAGFDECRVDKELGNEKTKIYMSRWDDPYVAGVATGVLLAGTMDDSGLGTPTNKIANTVFTTGWSKSPSGTGTGGTISESAGILTLASGGVSSDLRMGTPIVDAAIGKRYLMSIDQVENTGLTSNNNFYAPITSAQSTGTAAVVRSFAVDNAIFIGRIIQFFAATVNAPEQRIAVRNATSLAVQTKWQNPAAYEIPD